MDLYIVTAPVRFDRNYDIGEQIPDGIMDPRMVKRLEDWGKIRRVNANQIKTPVQSAEIQAESAHEKAELAHGKAESAYEKAESVHESAHESATIKSESAQFHKSTKN